MSRLRLTRLTFVGKGVPPAFVEFGPGLTLIYGASDTGKSYIVEAIDFMLGKKALKSIPEAEAYTTVLLSMVLPDGSELTLERSIKGGKFYARFGTHTDVSEITPDFSLSAAHRASAGKKESVSTFLLGQIGLNDKQIRKNLRNETQALSFRNLCFLCIIDETKMQSETPPPLSGQYTTATTERSVLKLLLQGEDDSAVAQEPGQDDRRRAGRSKAEVLEVVIDDLKESLHDVASPIELAEQLRRLGVAMEEHTASITSILESRAGVAAEHGSYARRVTSYQARLEEVHELLSRFSLLRAKYNSDLQRLEMIREAGSLLGYFRPGVCVFCGAPVEHQAAEYHSVDEVTEFGNSVLVEIQKTLVLREDLVSTLSDLGVQERRLRAEIEGFEAEMVRLLMLMDDFDARLLPQDVVMRELLDERSRVENGLSTYAQIERLEALRASVIPDEPDELPPPSVLTTGVLSEFGESVRSALESWFVPSGESVVYSMADSDLLVGNQLRSSRGKGMRAILHAGFTVALAQYCLDRGLAHPGFVVLDSPLTTYREPDPGSGEAPSEEEFASVSDAFYRYLDLQFAGQSIVVENTDPPAGLSDEAILIHFTKRSDQGRYGFFPPLVGED